MLLESLSAIGVFLLGLSAFLTLIVKTFSNRNKNITQSDEDRMPDKVFVMLALNLLTVLAVLLILVVRDILQ